MISFIDVPNQTLASDDGKKCPGSKFSFPVKNQDI